jgi:hypothetical protein
MECQMQVRSGRLAREKRPETARWCSNYLVEEEPKVAACGQFTGYTPPFPLTQLRMGTSHIRILLILFCLSPWPARRLGFGDIFSTKRPRVFFDCGFLWDGMGMDFVMWV